MLYQLSYQGTTSWHNLTNGILYNLLTTNENKLFNTSVYHDFIAMVFVLLLPFWHYKEVCDWVYVVSTN